MSVKKPFKSTRGFSHFDPIVTSYGHEIRVYESSSASAPHIWLAVNGVDSTNGDEYTSLHANMTLAAARLLRDQLTHLIDNHYQN